MKVSWKETGLRWCTSRESLRNHMLEPASGANTKSFYSAFKIIIICITNFEWCSAPSRGRQQVGIWARFCSRFPPFKMMRLSCNCCRTENWRAATLVASRVWGGHSRRWRDVVLALCYKCNLSPLQVGVNPSTNPRFTQHVQTFLANIAGYLLSLAGDTLLSSPFKAQTNKPAPFLPLLLEKVSQYWID